MSRIFADQIQKGATGVPLTLPTVLGTSGQILKTNGVGTFSWSGYVPPISYINGLIAPEGKGIVGSIMSHTDRYNIYSTGEWTSTGPWTTYVQYNAHQESYFTQFMNMALGDGRGGTAGTTEYMRGNDTDKMISRRILFSNGNRLGVRRDTYQEDNNETWAGLGFQIMPIRNISTVDITVTLNAYVSNYHSGDAGGAILMVAAPNTTSTTYSTVTGVTATRIAYSNSNSQSINLTGTTVVPAGKTILVCLGSQDQYRTTARFKDTNHFSGLSTTFSNSSIICDMRMLSALAKNRFNMPHDSASLTNSTFAPLWTSVATVYGNR